MNSTTPQIQTFRHQIDTDRFEHISTFIGSMCRTGVDTLDGGARAKFFAEDTIKSMSEADRHAILVTIPTPGCYYEPTYQVWAEVTS